MPKENHRERLDAMVEDRGVAWDLTAHDRAAIRWALRCVRAVENIAHNDPEWSRDDMVEEAQHAHETR